jgi:hypothetical protein
VTNLQRRLKKLEALLADPTGLVPHTQKWLEYWEYWLEKWARDQNFRPRERMPIEAARANIVGHLTRDKS